MRRGWWVQGAAADLHPALGGAGAARLHLDPLDAQRRVGASQQRAVRRCSASTGRAGSNSRWLALGRSSSSHIWKWMPFWTVILLAGRMAIPQEIYEAAEVDGATGLTPVHATSPSRCWPTSIWSARCSRRSSPSATSTRCISSPAAGRRCRRTCWPRSASATPSRWRSRDLGVAAVMSALPLLIPLVIILMRKLRTTEVQL